MTEETKKRCCFDTQRGAMKALKIIGMVILGAGFAVLMGFVVMWLWNWLMPMIFGVMELNYWQAIGIAILGNIIFGGFRGGHSSDDDKKGKKHIGGEIKKEIKKEIRKEFEKEYGSDSDTKDYDELYEKWWEKEGKSGFEEYMKDSED